jgi:hypothetical protein
MILALSISTAVAFLVGLFVDRPGCRCNPLVVLPVMTARRRRWHERDTAVVRTYDITQTLSSVLRSRRKRRFDSVSRIASSNNSTNPNARKS